MQIYLIETGCYSDRSIFTAVDDKEKAEEIKQKVKELGTEDVRVVEVPFNESIDFDINLSKKKSGLEMFECVLFRDGYIYTSPFYIYNSDIEIEFDWRADEFGTTECRVWARDEEHARKIASERLTIYKAREAGLV